MAVLPKTYLNGCLGLSPSAQIHWTRSLLAGLALGILLLFPVEIKAGQATIVFQTGRNGYTGASDDGTEGRLKLMDDRKSSDPKYPSPDYRHVIRFADLEKVIPAGQATIVSATLSLRYYDEWWSVNIYHVALHRSLDGTLDHIDPTAEDIAVIYGDRFKEGEKTPRPSWIKWKLRPETVADWLKNRDLNQGLVLRVAERDSSRGDKGNYGIKFRSCGFGNTDDRPRLEITYRFTGNLPPYRPVWEGRFRDATIGREHILRWRVLSPADPNGDAVAFDLDFRPPEGAWTPLARNAQGSEYDWNTTNFPIGDGCRIRIRGRDTHDTTSAWVEADGSFRLVRDEVPYQVGVATSLEKIRRDVPFQGKFGRALRVEMARNESEGAQLIVAQVNRDLRGLTVETSDLRSAGGVIAGTNVSVRQVGYVNTTSPSKYSVSYVGQWPDPLLELPRVDVPAGRVQPLWVSIHAPPETPPGEYRGTLIVKAENAPSVTVDLRATIWDFTLPTPGRFRAMVVDGGRSRPFLDRLLASRLSPAYVMVGWSWDKPQEPVRFENGQWDFSAADQMGEYCFARGMNIFTLARFPKLGKFGFPESYPADYGKRFSNFLAAYAGHLRDRGWLKLGHVYNIDEAPARQWPACRTNFELVKSAAPGVPVMQCLNEPKGVAALAGFADIWDVYIGQYHRSGVAERRRAGDHVIWAVCCYPSSHPNLFIDYPAMDARIIGWLSWKMGVGGFEYWSASSWGRNLKQLGPHPFLTRVETGWQANTFGDYNGDGYLVYPGANGAVLSSIRLENLRDGIEDYEMLALLADSVTRAKADGQGVEAAEKFPGIEEAVCREDLTYTREPQTLLAARRRVAECLEQLARASAQAAVRAPQ